MPLADEQLVTLGFGLGKDNVAPETDVPEGAVREALNVDIDKAGGPSRRPGYTSIYSGVNIHSLYSHDDMVLFVEDGVLNVLNPDYTATAVRSALDNSRLMSYDAVNGMIYYSNSIQTGIVDQSGVNHVFGVPSPASLPTLSESVFGAMPAGTYQVAITLEDADTGEESGTGRAGTITISEGSGIQIDDIPTLAGYDTRVYVSPPDGDVLYHHVTLASGVTSGVVTTTIEGRALETQFMDKMPAGHIVRYYKGRMWTAVGSTLIFSIAMRFGLYDPRHTYFQFPERITIVQPVQDGIFVVADKTYFLAGADPASMQQAVVYEYGGIEGTGQSVSPKAFNLDSIPDEVAFWYATTGAVLGLPSGQINPIMEDRLAIPAYDSGSTLLRESDGMRQMITALTNKGDSTGFGASDSAVAEVRQNGVII